MVLSVVPPALEAFAAVQFDDAVGAATALAREEDPLASLVHYGRGRANAMDTATSLIGAAEAFLAHAEVDLQSQVNELDLAAQTLDADVQTIREALEAFAQLDTPTGGHHAA